MSETSDRPVRTRGVGGASRIGCASPSAQTFAQVVDLLNQRERALAFLVDGIERIRDDGRLGAPGSDLRREVDRLLAGSGQSSRGG